MPVLVIAIVHCLVLFWPEVIWAQSRGHLGVFIQNVSRAPEEAGSHRVRGIDPRPHAQ